MNKLNLSRRNFLTGSAGALGALGLAASPKIFGSAVLASPVMQDGGPSDIDILNYALTLEHLEYAFYRDGLKMFSSKDVKRSRLLKDLKLKKGVTDNLLDYLKVIRDHEDIHVDTLTSVIESLGGDPVSECTYDFGYNDFDGFLNVAAALENTGVSAYTGAIADIDDSGLVTAAATIATVEARHASYLNLVTGAIPFPDAFDEPKDMDEILAIAGQFIVSCP